MTETTSNAFPIAFFFFVIPMRRSLVFHETKNTQHLPSYLNVTDTFCYQNTIGALILTSLSPRLHHHPTSHGIKRVRNQPCYCSDSLGNHPAHYDMHILWIRQHTCHQEQMSRVSTEAKGWGKDCCGRNSHPPSPPRSHSVKPATSPSIHI